MSDAKDWFDLPSDGESGDIAALTAPAAAEAVNVTPAAKQETTPAAASEPGKKGKKTAKASADETDVPEAQADQQDNPTIPCPRRDGGLVSEDDCFYCPEKNGCHALEDANPAQLSPTSPPQPAPLPQPA